MKFRGLEVFGVLDQAEGKASSEVTERTFKQSALDRRTAISYELRAKPRFEVPEFLLKRLLARDATTKIERLRAEIAARHSSSVGTQ